MGVNMNKMRKGYDSQKRGGEFYTFDQGDTLVLVHPPCRDDDEYEPTDGLNYVPVVVHYGVGKNNRMIVCLDSDNNPIVEHPFVKAFLKKKKVRLTGECPVCSDIADGTLSDEEADDSRPQTRYMWGVTPIGHRSQKSEPMRELTAKPQVMFQGKTLYDGLMELFFDNGDISDLGAAVLAKVSREGKGPRDTKYKVNADTATLKKPMKVNPKLKKIILKAIAEGGDCDLFKIVANMVKPPAEVRAALSGVAVDETDDEDDDIVDDEALDGEQLDEDEEGEEAPEDDEGDEEDDDEGDEEDDEGEDEEDDDEGDEDEEPEDEDEDEEPEPEPVKPKASKKVSKKAVTQKAKAKAKPKADDEDDLGLDALDEELSRISKNKGKKAKAG